METPVGKAKDKAKHRKGSSNIQSGKKRKTKGETCSLFLSQMVKKLRAKKKPKGSVQSSAEVVRSILDSITEAIPVQIANTSPAKKKLGPEKINQLPTRSADKSSNKIILTPKKGSQSPIRNNHNSAGIKPPTPVKFSSKPIWNSNIRSAVKTTPSPPNVNYVPVQVNSRNVKRIVNAGKESHIHPSTDIKTVSLTVPSSEAFDLDTSLPDPETIQQKGLQPLLHEIEFPKLYEAEVPKIETNETMVLEPDMEMEVFQPKSKGIFAVPRMPLVNSDLFKKQEEKKRRQRMKITTEDVASNTTPPRDVAKEITKHVETLRKISIIAEEFNQKTAKNLKEIIQSVQLDLLKKLDEVSKEEVTAATTSAIKDIRIQE